jgi:Na+/H+-dicarboxylate symporter
MSLTQRILLAMFLGLTLGAVLQWADLPQEHFLSLYFLDGLIDSGGKIFVTLLKMMVVPLVFVSLVCGAASLGATGSVGRLGGKTIGLYVLTTGMAVSMALCMALVINPGLSATDESGDKTQYTAYEAKQAPSVKDTLIGIFPSNPVKAMAEGKMLQVIIFALLMGLALSQAGEAGARIVSVFNDLNSVFMKMITMVIMLTPYGVFCLMVKLGATVGLEEIGKVFVYCWLLCLPRPVAQRCRSPYVPCRTSLGLITMLRLLPYPLAPPLTWMARQSCRAWLPCLSPNTLVMT